MAELTIAPLPLRTQAPFLGPARLEFAPIHLGADAMFGCRRRHALRSVKSRAIIGDVFALLVMALPRATALHTCDPVSVRERQGSADAARSFSSPSAAPRFGR